MYKERSAEDGKKVLYSNESHRLICAKNSIKTKGNVPVCNIKHLFNMPSLVETLS